MAEIKKLLRNLNKQVAKDIINSMNDWVRIIDKNSKVIFANKSLINGLKRNPIGEFCYKVFNKDAKCKNCISSQTFINGHSGLKEQLICDKYFSISSSPMKDDNGDIIAVIEVLRDVTSYKNLQTELEDKNRLLQNNLELAKTIQNKFLPWNFKSPDINFSFKYIPSDYLSGDLLDIFYIDNEHIGVYIADVSGHGISSSLITVFLYSKFCKKELSPAKALTKLFKSFNTIEINEELYITIFYMIINLKENILIYSNAGHNANPILINKDHIEFLRVKGIPISNWVSHAEYKDYQKKLFKNDKLFLYTDGIIEINKKDTLSHHIHNNNLKLLQSNNLSVDEILDIIAKKVIDFNKHKTYPIDDITFSLIEIKK